MKVATFNLKNDYISLLSTHWSKRKEAVGQFFQEEQPDIVGTQELTAASITDMETMLSQYSWLGEGRGGKRKGEYCAIFYRKDQLTCLEYGTFWLAKDEKTPNKRDWLSFFPRVCTWGLFQDRQGRRFRLYNTHLDVGSPMARKNGLKLIIEHVKADYGREPYPYFLTGDFNATPKSGVMNMVRGTDGDPGIFSGDSYGIVVSGKQDGCLGRKRRAETKTYHGFRGKTVGGPVDYIFASRGILIEKAEIIQKRYGGKYPSDHFPIIMKIKIEI